MRTVFTQQPDIVGHRGAGKDGVGPLPENTVESLRAAVEAGVDWVEIDARRTADGGLVLMHDPGTDVGFAVERTADELAAVGVVRLDDALAAVPESVGVMVEVKPSVEDALVAPDRTTAALLCPVLRRELPRRRLLVTSFDPAALARVRGEVPDVPLALNSWLRFPFDIAVSAAHHLGVDALLAHVGSWQNPPNRRNRPPDYIVEVAHRAGLQVGAWCPGPAEVRSYIAAGADAVTVDLVPEVVAELRGTPVRS